MELLIPVSLIENFHFLRPIWLLALLPVLLFFFAMWRVNSVVTAWDKAMVQPLEKAIMSSDLGLNPATAGTLIRVPLPPLTEERRKDMIRVVRGEAEGSRVAIRNIRRDAIGQIKELMKEKMVSEDEEHKGEDDVQKLTDEFVAKIDSVLAEKEKELLEI